jgi:tyrosyl-tRNA synthetase
MSKSLGNYIGVTESPTEMFGKCMSIPDELVEKYFTNLTDVPEDEVQAILGLHPREAKVALARQIVTEYHGADAGQAAVAEFDRVFKQGGLPDEVPEVLVPAERLRDGAILVANALQIAGICNSGSDGRRLVKGGGVKVDGQAVQDVHATMTAGSYLLQSGKRKAVQIVIP